MGLYQDAHEDTNGNVYVNLQDGLGNGITSHAVTGGVQALDTYIAGGMITTGVPDKTTYVYGASGFQPVGGVFQDTSPTLIAGQSGAFRLTANRAVQMNLRTAAGAELGDSNADGLWVKLGDGTNVGSFSATSEQFTQLRQGGNVNIINASGEQLVKDTTADTQLTSINGKLSPSTGTLSQVALSTSSQTALALNASRKGFIMVNDSNKTAYVAFSATATTAAYTYKLMPNTTIEPNFGSYTGVISVIAQSGVIGNLVITELT